MNNILGNTSYNTHNRLQVVSNFLLLPYIIYLHMYVLITILAAVVVIGCNWIKIKKK